MIADSNAIIHIASGRRSAPYSEPGQCGQLPCTAAHRAWEPCSSRWLAMQKFPATRSALRMTAFRNATKASPCTHRVHDRSRFCLCRSTRHSAHIHQRLLYCAPAQHDTAKALSVHVHSARHAGANALKSVTFSVRSGPSECHCQC